MNCTMDPRDGEQQVDALVVRIGSHLPPSASNTTDANGTIMIHPHVGVFFDHQPVIVNTHTHALARNSAAEQRNVQGDPEL
jgi:hypothetical protein